jgi:cytochrome b561
MKRWHGFLVILVIVHTAAGFKHLLIDRDKVFQRMWF